MLKLLTLTAISVSFLCSSELSHDTIFAFLKNSFSSEKTYKFENVTIDAVYKTENLQDWDAYFITLNFDAYGRKIPIKEILFFDGKHISRDFFTVATDESIKSELLKKWDEITNKGTK